MTDPMRATAARWRPAWRAAARCDAWGPCPEGGTFGPARSASAECPRPRSRAATPSCDQGVRRPRIGSPGWVVALAGRARLRTVTGRSWVEARCPRVGQPVAPTGSMSAAVIPNRRARRVDVTDALGHRVLVTRRDPRLDRRPREVPGVGQLRGQARGHHVEVVDLAVGPQCGEQRVAADPAVGGERVVDRRDQVDDVAGLVEEVAVDYNGRRRSARSAAAWSTPRRKQGSTRVGQQRRRQR